MNEVLAKMKEIRSVFIGTQMFYAGNDNAEALTGYLENTKAEFRSVAYESASMCIALDDLNAAGKLTDWFAYSNGPALLHKAQVYIGLGWAIAKLNYPFSKAVEGTDVNFHFRTADGCGYYDGCFRQQQAITEQSLPAYLNEYAIPGYYQGIGRSLWYTANAEIEKVNKIIKTFPGNLHAAMWRGVGIAVAYVGGCSDIDLENILQYAGTNALELAIGSSLAAGSRSAAGTITKDTDHCSRFFYASTAGKKNISSSEPAAIVDDAVYFNWMNEVEETLQSGYVNNA